ncbi:hypothetical protein [Peribacillus loiseleuriae]|uniref:Uncharacterized protein n=1 Tax=Peribacillus loiseleuriae TaxID=1679170 RepID=A0A0K9GSL5_9BACI|nr:hypothetical protein [Peribacillus loiseleuriae]KMY49625.1 hypothetical protein AC625_08805 [Peribacillus loiseleuriae]
MNQIVIKENIKFANIQLSNLHEEGIIEPNRNIKYQQIVKINYLIQKYNLQPNHKIINEYYSDEGDLVKRVEHLVEEYTHN